MIARPIRLASASAMVLVSDARSLASALLFPRTSTISALLVFLLGEALEPSLQLVAARLAGGSTERLELRDRLARGQVRDVESCELPIRARDEPVQLLFVPSRRDIATDVGEEEPGDHERRDPLLLP